MSEGEVLQLALADGLHPLLFGTTRLKHLLLVSRLLRAWLRWGAEQERGCLAFAAHQTTLSNARPLLLLASLLLQVHGSWRAVTDALLDDPLLLSKPWEYVKSTLTGTAQLHAWQAMQELGAAKEAR